MRVKTGANPVTLDDGLQGRAEFDLARDVGDFVIRRRDGLVAYATAVVVDDAWQAITEVVRGMDLLDVTPSQLWLQQVLGLPHPAYMHVPVAVNRVGQKLSKQTGARALNDQQAGANLVAALDFLEQRPPAELTRAEPEVIWSWARDNWQADVLAGRHNREVPDQS